MFSAAATISDSMICVLRVLPPTASVQEVCLHPGQSATVGRQSASDLAVQDRYMSRCHFMVEAVGDGFRVRDLNSRNRTRVNGSAITVAELQSGDRIQAGSTTFAVEFHAEGDPRHWTRLGSVSGVGDTEETESVGSSSPAGLSRRAAESGLPRPPFVGPNSAAVACGDSTTRLWWPSARAEIPEGLESFGLERLSEVSFGQGFVIPSGTGRSIELCETLGQYYRLVLVINRSQLDPTCASLLDYSVQRGRARRITQTVYRVDGDAADSQLSQLLRRSSRRDAAVCLGFRYADPAVESTVAELIDQLCYPSLLYHQLVQQDAEGIGRIYKRISFLLFEMDLSGDVYWFAEPGFRVAGTLTR